ncbi:MAG TPA: NYN domain-containing protein [Bauldia sp.]|nr:NYN domain-containing protein [Bauldia sp.]
MADTIKSALFVDYDSFHRGQEGEQGNTAERIAQTSAAWVAALESGKLIMPPLENGARRRVLIRRCYADPAVLGLNRSALIASGFEVIDCPHQPGRKRNAADLHMVIDTIDALDHPAGSDEFILLSADADFTPVLLRLRAHNRNTVIYGDEATTAAYKAIADGMIDAQKFGAVLAGEAVEPKPAAPAADETPAAAEGAAAALATAPDRNEIESLARKVHAATNVPMFSPRTFADLFRLLAQEIGEHGYHFQNTAENVTEKLIAAGRNVNRRQVLFVVKGLALKGHVFSTTDTPERLAEVFREQVLYLIGNAGLELDEREKAMLPSWIIGRAPTVAKPVPTATRPVPKATPPAPVPKAVETEEAGAAKKPPAIRRRVVRPASAAKEEAPALIAKAEPSFDMEEPAKTEAPAEKREPTPASRTADLRATVASRFAAITKGTFGAKSTGDTAARAKPPVRPVAGTTATPSPKPPSPRPVPSGSAARSAGAGAAKAGAAKTKPAAEEGNKDALESSILAAIAQAVDVLVEDSDPAKAKSVDLDVETAEASEERTPPPSSPEPPADPEPSPGGDSEDIGDEIQRIIASYSRARQQGE